MIPASTLVDVIVWLWVYAATAFLWLGLGLLIVARRDGTFIDIPKKAFWWWYAISVGPGPLLTMLYVYPYMPPLIDWNR